MPRRLAACFTTATIPCARRLTTSTARLMSRATFNIESSSQRVNVSVGTNRDVHTLRGSFPASPVAEHRCSGVAASGCTLEHGGGCDGSIEGSPDARFLLRQSVFAERRVVGWHVVRA